MTDHGPSIGWPQSFPFSCGPAALGSVLTSLGWSPAGPRVEEEIEIWRESTAVACPGAHPLGLALAAERRGFRAVVRTSGPSPWLWHHIRTRHSPLPRAAYRRIEDDLFRRCQHRGIPVETSVEPPSPGEVGLLLTTARRTGGETPDPHWIALIPREGTLQVVDPLRRVPRRSARPLSDWWSDSGFEGTRSWISFQAPPPEDDRSSRTPPQEGHDHHHHHGGEHRHLVGSAWTAEDAVRILESPERRRTQDPKVLWRRIGLRPGEVVVDVGAGTGFFAVEAARQVGPGGRVYAVDLSPELIEHLRSRRDAEHLPQITPLLSTRSEIPVPPSVADVVLLANVLHDVPDTTVAEAVRLLKPDGRFVNVDWKKEGPPEGPPRSVRLSPEEAEARLRTHGLVPVDRWEFGPWHYALLLRRPASRRSRRTGTKP